MVSLDGWMSVVMFRVKLANEVVLMFACVMFLLSMVTLAGVLESFTDCELVYLMLFTVNSAATVAVPEEGDPESDVAWLAGL